MATAADRAALISRYRDGIDEVRRALAEVGDERLDARPPDGGWTPRRVVHHLADSEMTGAIRLRRLLAEDAPAIGPYDEERFADALRYDDRPIASSLAAFAAARLTSAELLDRLDDGDWARAGTHPDYAEYSVDDWLRIYAAHAHDHAAQIRTAAAAADS